MKNKIILIDFDGTCVTHEFPKVGKDIGAGPVLKELVANGHKLVLFTMRSDVTNPVSNDPDIHCVAGQYLTDAVDWFKERDIPLYGINVNPDQLSWTTSPKAYGNLMIDDGALGIPLITGAHKKPYVDWKRVRELLVWSGYIRPENGCVKVIVAGSRNFHNYPVFEKELLKILNKLSQPGKLIVSGMAAGPDSMAIAFARKINMPVKQFPADWQTHGKAAGIIRNAQMAEYSDILIAFWDGRSKGTKNMIEQMQTKGKTIFIVEV